jgi:hypothetical protein
MSTFKTNKQEQSILDCFTYDLTSFFSDDYNEIDSEETPATVMIVYEKELPWQEFDVFDTIQFRIFFDKESITGSNPINVRFLSKNKIKDVDILKTIINKIASIYGNDNFGRMEWNSKDDQIISSKNKYRRVWTIEHGESFVSVELNDDGGIFLDILFFNNLLEKKEIES